MTLQYRIRSKHEDRKWQHRVYLCDRLFADAYDRWCVTGNEFPQRGIVAGVLFLFSPRCNPFDLSPYRLRERLAEMVESPEKEYRLAWPQRDESAGKPCITALTDVIAEAVKSWTSQDTQGPSFEEVVRQLVEVILDQRYVVFHHRETTRRDVNHFGI